MPIFFIFTQGKTTHVTLYGMKVNKYYLFFMENLFIHICKPVFSPKLASFFSLEILPIFVYLTTISKFTVKKMHL